MQRCIRVVLADSHQMVAGSLCRYLNDERQVEVIALANTARQVVDATTTHQPEVAVIDTELADNAMKACKEITASCPNTAVLVLSPFDRDIHLAQSWAIGAVGFITKRNPIDELVSLIHRAQPGKPLFTTEQLHRIQRWQQYMAPQLDALTSREWEVLHLIIAGKSNRDISDTFNLAESTVAKHVTALLNKTALDSRHSLISFAHQHHITDYTSTAPLTCLARGATLHLHGYSAVRSS